MARFGARFGRFGQLFRFYQAALVNTAFGYGVYALLVRLGVNPFVATTISQVLGTAFNYFTYSRHVFRGSRPARWRFALSYVVGYGLLIGSLAVYRLVFASPYLAGAASTLTVSLINYFILKRFVFTPAVAP